MRRLVRLVAGMTVLAAASPAGAQWPHLAGQPLRSAPIHTDADGAVYVVNPDSDSVTRLGPAVNGAQATLWEAATGDYPRTLTLWGDTVLTANQSADTISQLRKSDGAPVRADVPLPFGCAPYGICGNHAGDRLYVTCQGMQEVIVLDGALAEVARIRLDWPTPRALAISADDRLVYVSHFLTVEPSHDAHVSEIDAAASALTLRRFLTVPADRATCETQNSGQGVTNIVNAIGLTPPEGPAANQLWVGGTLQNNLTKGLFKRYAGFAGRPEVALFDLPCPSDDASVSCRFESFPRGNGTAALKRNLYKSSFHDITRFVIWKLDLTTGAVVGKLDVDEANHATDFTFSRDGQVAYAVDQMFNSFHVFSTRRGQGGNPATLFAPVNKFGPFGADPAQPCDADALGSVTSERDFILAPQSQITPIDGGDPIRVVGGLPQVAATGVDFDTRAYHETGVAEMRAVPDAIGTAPMGVSLSPDGCIVYVANYLSRNVVAVSAQPGATACQVGSQTVDFRCTKDLARSCTTVRDCPSVGGFCNHPGGPACTTEADCPPGQGPCLNDNECVPLVVADPVATTALVSEEIPAEILDGKILFNTAARDSSTPNGIGLGSPAPAFNAVRKGCSNALATPCTSDVQCPGGSCMVVSLPGEVVSTAHDASYVACTACHVDHGGQDGRTWDFSQFGASLRNTMDLRGRSRFAPGTCDALLSANPARIGAACHFDAECGTGSGPGACVANPNMIPPHLSGDDRARYFNPALTVHWNGDRMEVEGFEFTYRSLLGAGDCDGLENDPTKCLGALLPRSPMASTATIPDDGRFEGDLGAPLRNLMIPEPTLGKDVNAGVRLTHMADFVYSLTEFPRNPFLGPDGSGLSEAARRGRRLFTDETTRCAQCHNGPTSSNQLFTDKVPNGGFDSSQPPGAASNNPFKRQAVGTANLFDLTDPDAVAKENNTYQNSVGSSAGRGIPASRGPLVDYVTPVMNDVWNTPPFLHDGSAPTLLDVVRPCRTAVTSCNQKGLGRNVDDLHGRTSHLTPQQLNDLVAFQEAPHNPVGESEAVVRAGALELTRVRVKLGKRSGRGSYVVVGTLAPGSLPVDPVAGGLSLTLAVPRGIRMSLHEVIAGPGVVKSSRGGRRFRFRTRTPETLTLGLRRLKDGDYRLVAKGKRANLDALDGSSDVTVALVVGNVQFVENRLLSARGRGGRTLVLARRGGPT